MHIIDAVIQPFTPKIEFMNTTETINGNSKEDFIIGMLPGSLRNYHPDDFKIFSEKILPEILKFFASLPANDKNNYRISYNYRHKMEDNSFIHLQQHIIYSGFNQNNLSGGNLSSITDLTDLKHDNSITLVITKIQQEKEEVILQKKISNEHLSLLTYREKEIIMLAKKGYSSKEIASKLLISQNTVRNHKKHMMEKTNTYNIAGLIDYLLANENF